MVVEQLVQDLEGQMQVFNGRGGIELLDSLRAGCAGLILRQSWLIIRCKFVNFGERIVWRSGETSERNFADDRLQYANNPHLICYGKRLLAARIGLNVFDRSPFQAPTKFSLQKFQNSPVTSVHFEQTKWFES